MSELKCNLTGCKDHPNRNQGSIATYCENIPWKSVPLCFKEESEKEDKVNNPKHYKIFPNMEVLDVIKKTLTLEEFVGYCKGNVLKYRLRAGKKDNLQQDIDKADYYQNLLDGS